MNNEPVAWMDEDENVVFEKCKAYPIPLYTHQYERPHNTVLVPCDKLAEMQAEIAQLKYEKSSGVYANELTDEEIGKFKGEWYRGDYASFYDLVRAILLKAQEK